MSDLEKRVEALREGIAVLVQIASECGQYPVCPADALREDGK